MIARLLIFFLILNQGILSYSGTIDPNIPDKKYIEYGEKFTYVGKLCGVYEDEKMFCASAVAIGDHHILTAAHVVKNAKNCFFTINGRDFCVQNIVYHSDFDKDEFGRGDIAIGYIDENIGLNFYPELYDNGDEDGKLCSIAGYGITGNFIRGATKSDGKKRAGSNIIDYISSDLLICSPSRRGKSHTSLEFLISSGDSGGGLFIDGKLAGINSCVMSDGSKPKLLSTYETESGHTRISKYIQWIKDHKK